MIFRTASWAPFLLALALAACDRGPAGDRPGSQDSGSARPGAPAEPDFPDTETGRLLTQHLGILAGHGKDAEEKYQASLAVLRSRAPEVSRELVAFYPAVAEDRYFRRWAILETLRELRDASALPLAIRVAGAPLPRERFTEDPERASQDEELRIQIKAAEIIAAVAAERVSGADAALLGLVKHEDLGVRRTAIRGYLAAGGPAEQGRRRDDLQRLVAERDRGLITLETTEIRKIPHPRVPERFDVGRGRSPEGPPPAVKK